MFDKVSAIIATKPRAVRPGFLLFQENMPETVTVYGLYSTRDGVIRYVGQTNTSAWQRFVIHKRHARRTKDRSRVGEWMRNEWSEGFEVKPRVLVANAVWDRDEKAEIARLRAAGIDLFNVRAGGSRRDPHHKLGKPGARHAAKGYYRRLLCGDARKPGSLGAARLLVNYALGQR